MALGGFPSMAAVVQLATEENFDWEANRQKARGVAFDELSDQTSFVGRVDYDSYLSQILKVSEEELEERKVGYAAEYLPPNVFVKPEKAASWTKHPGHVQSALHHTKSTKRACRAGRLPLNVHPWDLYRKVCQENTTSPAIGSLVAPYKRGSPRRLPPLDGEDGGAASPGGASSGGKLTARPSGASKASLSLKATGKGGGKRRRSSNQSKGTKGGGARDAAALRNPEEEQFDVGREYIGQLMRTDPAKRKLLETVRPPEDLVSSLEMLEALISGPLPWRPQRKPTLKTKRSKREARLAAPDAAPDASPQPTPQQPPMRGAAKGPEQRGSLSPARTVDFTQTPARSRRESAALSVCSSGTEDAGSVCSLRQGATPFPTRSLKMVNAPAQAPCVRKDGDGAEVPPAEAAVAPRDGESTTVPLAPSVSSRRGVAASSRGSMCPPSESLSVNAESTTGVRKTSNASNNGMRSKITTAELLGRARNNPFFAFMAVNPATMELSETLLNDLVVGFSQYQNDDADEPMTPLGAGADPTSAKNKLRYTEQESEAPVVSQVEFRKILRIVAKRDADAFPKSFVQQNLKKLAALRKETCTVQDFCCCFFPPPEVKSCFRRLISKWQKDVRRDQRRAATRATLSDEHQQEIRDIFALHALADRSDGKHRPSDPTLTLSRPQFRAMVASMHPDEIDMVYSSVAGTGAMTLTQFTEIMQRSYPPFAHTATGGGFMTRAPNANYAVDEKVLRLAKELRNTKTHYPTASIKKLSKK
eukprot:TRINITY_DN18501_c0_g1_i1.p1 TRINITY_DN18501_c0_g1~~TRINITY_DN18501_c0_g1_i1.p1  ORF type:complete len:761 (+),score=242.63 TRINITY_DN18501_c0_g1_i1:62-2344(+)